MSRPLLACLIVALSSAFLLCPPCAAATITVDLDGAADYSEIQPAIDAAQDGDTVLVKPGEYVINESITFRGKAITVRGEAGAEVTTIRMSVSYGSVVVFANGETDASGRGCTSRPLPRLRPLAGRPGSRLRGSAGLLVAPSSPLRESRGEL